MTSGGLWKEADITSSEPTFGLKRCSSCDAIVCNYFPDFPDLTQVSSLLAIDTISSVLAA